MEYVNRQYSVSVELPIADESEALDLATERVEATKRRYENEVDSRCLRLIERQQRIQQRKELIAKWQAELMRPIPEISPFDEEWRNRPIMMYQPSRYYS